MRLGRSLIVAALLVLLLPPIWLELRPDDRPLVALALPVPEGERYQVYVADWGYHTAIIVEQSPGWVLGPVGEERSRFVEFAWGDRRFYMESNHWPHSLFATLLLPTASVTYVDGRDRPPDGGFRSLHSRELSAAEMRALMSALESSIARDGTGKRAAPYATTPGHPGRFYPGVGSYLWWVNCNRWTLDRLAAVGLASRGRGTLFSGQVAGRLVGFQRVRDAR